MKIRRMRIYYHLKESRLRPMFFIRTISSVDFQNIPKKRLFGALFPPSIFMGFVIKSKIYSQNFDSNLNLQVVGKCGFKFEGKMQRKIQVSIFHLKSIER